MGLKLLYFWFD